LQHGQHACLNQIHTIVGSSGPQQRKQQEQPPPHLARFDGLWGRAFGTCRGLMLP
jgi:hypothetical protein